MSLRKAKQIKERSCLCTKGYFSTVTATKAHWKNNRPNQISIPKRNKDSPKWMGLNSEIDTTDDDCSHPRDPQPEHNKLSSQISKKEFLDPKNELLKWYPFFILLFRGNQI